MVLIHSCLCSKGENNEKGREKRREEKRRKEKRREVV
jgi:hypothetical protein